MVFGTTGEVANLDGPEVRRLGDILALDVPEGWDVRVNEPLVIRANGVRLGAEVSPAASRRSGGADRPGTAFLCCGIGTGSSASRMAIAGRHSELPVLGYAALARAARGNTASSGCAAEAA